LPNAVSSFLDTVLLHIPVGVLVRPTPHPPSAVVEISVQDTGTGIPSTALPHIFERFYVVDPARARSGSGTGLGLAIVKHIVEAHGGSIRVHSELGAGTTFVCTLPREGGGDIASDATAHAR
ncbi:MAG: sensor histidine kinase, partial [Candidatus Eremiobacter antarcticus]